MKHWVWCIVFGLVLSVPLIAAAADPGKGSEKKEDYSSERDALLKKLKELDEKNIKYFHGVRYVYTARPQTTRSTAKERAANAAGVARVLAQTRKEKGDDYVAALRHWRKVSYSRALQQIGQGEYDAAIRLLGPLQRSAILEVDPQLLGKTVEERRTIQAVLRVRAAKERTEAQAEDPKKPVPDRAIWKRGEGRRPGMNQYIGGTDGAEDYLTAATYWSGIAMELSAPKTPHSSRHIGAAYGYYERLVRWAAPDDRYRRRADVRINQIRFLERETPAGGLGIQPRQLRYEYAPDAGKPEMEIDRPPIRDVTEEMLNAAGARLSFLRGNHYMRMHNWSSAQSHFKAVHTRFKGKSDGEEALYWAGFCSEKVYVTVDTSGRRRGTQWPLPFYQQLVDTYPDGKWAADAKKRIAALTRPAASVESLSKQIQQLKEALAQGGAGPEGAAKTDRVFMRNGDIYSGKIGRFSADRLKITLVYADDSMTLDRADIRKIVFKE